MATAAHRLVARARRMRAAERGIGLIELLMAMSILAIAISAQLAVFASSYASIGRASVKGTAASLADKQMETERTLPSSCVYLTPASGDTAYSGDSAYSASQIAGSSCSPYTTPATSAT